MFTSSVLEYDLELLIEDFILLCTFVGNDFLPHLPALKIRENALDVILFYYLKYLNASKTYLLVNDNIQFDFLFNIIGEIGIIEVN